MRDLAMMAVELARKGGAGEAEGYVTDASELHIEVRDGEIESLKQATERGVGVRVLVDGRLGFAFASDLSPESVAAAAARAVAMARLADIDTYRTFPQAPPAYPELQLHDARIKETPLEKKVALARQIEVAGRAYDARVTITEACAYQEATVGVAVANSRGVAAEFTAAYCGGHAFLVAVADGDYQTGFSLRYGWHLEDVPPEEIGREAAARAVRMLGAKRARTREVPVIFDPYVATSFLGVLAPALAAQAVQKGKSLFAGKVGQRVGSPLVTIIDSGLNTAGIGAGPFDGEGVPSGETVLIKDGELQGFLYDTYTAAKEGRASTGNGTRGSFRSLPDAGATNFYLVPGNLSREELLRDVPSGFYVTQVMGMHTANPISGDFSVGAAGLWIEDGAPAYPVRGAAIAGNILELLGHIEAIADDLTFVGSVGAPTIKIGRMCVSG